MAQIRVNQCVQRSAVVLLQLRRAVSFWQLFGRLSVLIPEKLKLSGNYAIMAFDDHCKCK